MKRMFNVTFTFDTDVEANSIAEAKEIALESSGLDTHAIMDNMEAEEIFLVDELLIGEE